MFKSLAVLLTTALFSLSVTAEGNSAAQNIGYTGTLYVTIVMIQIDNY